MADFVPVVWMYIAIRYRMISSPTVDRTDYASGSLKGRNMKGGSLVDDADSYIVHEWFPFA